MPKPTLKENDLIKILKENIKLLSELDKNINIILQTKKENIFLNCDKEQIARVFFNLIKNSIESIQQKSEKTPNFDKKILIEISDINDHIKINLKDNGILNPYFTTKKNGTGLGLSIVNKIINDHNGELEFFSISDGAKIEINFKK